MNQISLPRRDFLYGLGSSVGSLALTSLLQAEEAGLKPRKGHLPARAKRCIFLMMEGGPSHIDTFDPKPELAKRHLQVFNRQGERESAMSSGKRYFVQSPFEFVKAGQSGADITTEWNHLREMVDDMCFFRGAQVESVNHPTACYHVNTGNRFGGDPALGSWVTYGLGSSSQNLPGFVVLPRNSYPQGGGSNWSNGFLPADFQGTPLRPEGSPILDLTPPRGVTRKRQRANLDLLAKLNAKHQESRAESGALEARMASYELAYRMQAEVPGVLDLEGETERTREMYGVGKQHTDAFGRKCLLARRLVESGVRFVQAYAGNWDSHDYIERAHGSLIRSVDQPIAALLKDLKQRDMLKDTLVFFCGEFGRTPDNGMRGGKSYGRDHNAKAMAMWFAGGGTRGGATVGATDELGGEAVECVHHIRDVHVTLLHLLGLDDNRLTYHHAGRFKQLSQFGGEVIEELLG
ncbi:MAG TPA: hypothetical protein DD438_11290 [Verrucomicrobiales bacterium]|nr:hypothetical protein [Roseibacillus sp.]HBM78685.1 hypothetical protein [Verrucomicrobiales bacterium]HCQ38678.1 hypothetical protein [Verrucomicrobiales bacterium]|tara:strand:- start:5 stop:1393 length:1389 start_codon:yes stop_codon:yes gene_type:complete